MVCLPRASDSPDRRAFPTRRSSDPPSQGWGSEEEIMDPVYSTNAFYDALIEVDGYEAGDINDVAQQVQRSGHPGAYRDHETEGRLYSSALTGMSGANLHCVLGRSEE